MSCTKMDGPLGNTKDPRQNLDLSQFENQYRLLYTTGSGLYAVDYDGGNSQQLIEHPWMSEIQVSPDAQSFFVASGDNYENRGIYRYDMDGANPQLVIDLGHITRDILLSPDGQWLYFISESRGPTASWVEHLVVDRNGHQQTVIATNRNFSDFQWAADGSGLYFTDLDNYGRQLSFRNLNDSTITALSPEDEYWSWCRISPDGQWAIYSLLEDIHSMVYISDLDGGNRLNLSGTEGGYMPLWAPDGQRVLFNSDRDGDNDLYIINTDGSGFRNLSADNYETGYLALWAPDGSRLSFTVAYQGDRSDSRLMIMDPESGYYQFFPDLHTNPVWVPLPISQMNR
ncbi:MAG TPA: DUF5050 domain-containing protein [Calditrichia bacterium]|nr:DUF5050 domain-containing protein [Calditrichia bacterium]